MKVEERVEVVEEVVVEVVVEEVVTLARWVYRRASPTG